MWVWPCFLRVATRLHPKCDLKYSFCLLCAKLVQALNVGGLFPQFRLGGAQKYVIDEVGVRVMAGALLAINRVNNKTDKVYDNLLPNVQVRCG